VIGVQTEGMQSLSRAAARLKVSLWPGNWKTAAFGYHARALALNSGSEEGPLAIRDMRRRLFNGERRSRELKSGGGFRFRGRVLSVRRFSDAPRPCCALLEQTRCVWSHPST
jgi:hypothetical protein